MLRKKYLNTQFIRSGHTLFQIKENAKKLRRVGKRSSGDEPIEHASVEWDEMNTP